MTAHPTKVQVNFGRKIVATWAKSLAPETHNFLSRHDLNALEMDIAYALARADLEPEPRDARGEAGDDPR